MKAGAWRLEPVAAICALPRFVVRCIWSGPEFGGLQGWVDTKLKIRWLNSVAHDRAASALHSAFCSAATLNPLSGHGLSATACLTKDFRVERAGP
jgi:hypothetical protein